MQFSLNKIKQIIILFCFIIPLIVNQSKAQSVTANDDNLLSLTISCPNNPQCIFSGQDLFPITTTIKNNTNQNLEIPLEAMRSFLTSAYLENIQTGKVVGNIIPSGMPMPELYKNLTLLPAHGEIVTTGNYTKNYLKTIFHKEKVNQIVFYNSIVAFAHFQGSKEPIGYYKEGKFEKKRFILKDEITITKK